MYLGPLSTFNQVKGFFRRTMLHGEKGAELVEAALVIPLLLTILLGTIWMGRAYMVYEALTRAAREGARYEVLPTCATCGNSYPDPQSSNCTSASQSTAFSNYISPSLSATGLDPSQVQSSYCEKTQWLNNGDNPQECGVVISMTYPTVLAIPFTSLRATTINISTEVQMRYENQPAPINGGTPTCP
jgi:hypothetical protein